MTAPNVLGLEGPLDNLRAGISAVHIIADSIDANNSEEARALDWICYNMIRDYDAAKAWFDEAHEAYVEAMNKVISEANGPRAVS